MRTRAQERRNGKGTTILYVVLRLLVVAILIRGIFLREWNAVFFCALTLVLFMLPSIVERRLKIDLPSGLEIIVLLFIFAAEILGELGAFYLKVSIWDLILHTTNGFLMAAIGIALIDVLNNSPKINMSLSPFFVAFVAFCFSMTIGVLWEFTEFAADQFLGTDMQKDTMLSSINSVDLNPAGVNTSVRIDDITNTVIFGTQNGEKTETSLPGYLDIGLNDTMEDMFVNLIGAVIFSIIGGIFIAGRGKGRGKVAGKFIPRMLTEEEIDEMEEEIKAQRLAIRRRFGSKRANSAEKVASVDDNDSKTE
ncbi:MAG: hypothetical protein RSD32_03420 [Oscillospiraceae bacterium]